MFGKSEENLTKIIARRKHYGDMAIFNTYTIVTHKIYHVLSCIVVGSSIIGLRHFMYEHFCDVGNCVALMTCPTYVTRYLSYFAPLQRSRYNRYWYSHGHRTMLGHGCYKNLVPTNIKHFILFLFWCIIIYYVHYK